MIHIISYIMLFSMDVDKYFAPSCCLHLVYADHAIVKGLATDIIHTSDKHLIKKNKIK